MSLGYLLFLASVVLFAPCCGCKDIVLGLVLSLYGLDLNLYGLVLNWYGLVLKVNGLYGFLVVYLFVPLFVGLRDQRICLIFFRYV